MRVNLKPTSDIDIPEPRGQRLRVIVEGFDIWMMWNLIFYN